MITSFNLLFLCTVKIICTTRITCLIELSVLFNLVRRHDVLLSNECVEFFLDSILWGFSCSCILIFEFVNIQHHVVWFYIELYGLVRYQFVFRP